MSEQKMYICRRMKLLSYLTSCGYKPISVIPDGYNPKYRCWLFIETPELLEAVDTYYRLRPIK